MAETPRATRQRKRRKRRRGLHGTRAKPASRDAPDIAMIVGLAGALLFFVFPLTTFLPVVADEVLGSGAGGYSMLLSAIGLGAIVGGHRNRAPREIRFLRAVRPDLLHRGTPGRGGRRALRKAVAGHGPPLLLRRYSGVRQLHPERPGSGVGARRDARPYRGGFRPHLTFRGGSPLGALLLGYSVTAFGPGLAISASLICMSLLCATLLYRSPRFRGR